MSVKEYTSRDYVVITKNDFHKTILHPEKLLIQFDQAVKAKPYDLGSLCFSEREPIVPGWDAGKNIKPRKVVESSLQKSRRKLLVSLIDYWYTGGYRDSSINSDTTKIQRFIDWCDNNGHSDFAANEVYSVAAYRAYIEHLFERIIRDGNLKPETGSSYQSGARYILKLLYPEKSTELIATAPTITFERDRVASPEQQDVHDFVASIVSFSRSSKKAVMEDDFPFNIVCGEVEATILASNNDSVISPLCDWVPHLYDRVNQRYRTEDEYICHMTNYYKEKGYKQYYISTWKRDHENFSKSLNLRNQNKKDCFYRSIWAQKVIRGYAVIIQMITGANPSSLVNLEYENALDVARDSVNKELVSVKFRANGLKVSYPIHRKGLKIIREYLHFREWYLDGRDSKYLFFTDVESSGKLSEIVPLRADFQSRLYKQLSGKLIPPSVKNLTATKSRKYKSIVLKSIGISSSDTAKALNHTKRMNDIAYSTPSKGEMKEQLSNHWGSLRAYASEFKIMDGDASHLKRTAVGHCDDYGAPVSTKKAPPIEPDCRKQFGCLYCEHYVCHADDDDILKLFSLRYVIEAVRSVAPDFDKADELFQGLCVRIEFILKEIQRKHPQLEEKIRECRRKVYDLGLLTPFWESRLSRYEEIGVVL